MFLQKINSSIVCNPISAKNPAWELFWHSRHEATKNVTFYANIVQTEDYFQAHGYGLLTVAVRINSKKEYKIFFAPQVEAFEAFCLRWMPEQHTACRTVGWPRFDTVRTLLRSIDSRSSQAVSHLSTAQAHCCLTSVLKW